MKTAWHAVRTDSRRRGSISPVGKLVTKGRLQRIDGHAGMKILLISRNPIGDRITLCGTKVNPSLTDQFM